MERLISVIVPVYNSKDYLEKSVKSICDQTYPNLEIILIDDGSTDGSGEICDSLSKKDSRIVVMHKENGGQSDARNCGLDIAAGEYIGFVDSDDEIDPEMYETMLKNALEYKAQISCCGTLIQYSDGKTGHFSDDTSLIKEFSKNEALIEFTNNSIITASLWDKLFHRSIFEDLRLKKGIIYEDFQIMPYCIVKADKVIYTGRPMYRYNVTSFSSIRGHRSTKLYDIVPVCSELVEFYRSICPEGLPGMENQLIDHCLTLFYTYYDDSAWSEKRNELREILLSTDKNTLGNLYPDNRLKIKLFRMRPELYIRIYRAFQMIKNRIRK